MARNSMKAAEDFFSDVREAFVFVPHGIVSGSENLEACQQHEEGIVLNLAVEERSLRMPSNPQLYQPLAKVSQAEEWLKLFEVDALRYPVMVVLGHTRTGKAEWAKSRFKHPVELKIGIREFFPGVMRSFKRMCMMIQCWTTSGICNFSSTTMEKLQGKYDWLVNFGCGGTCAYLRDLFGWQGLRK